MRLPRRLVAAPLVVAALSGATFTACSSDDLASASGAPVAPGAPAPPEGPGDDDHGSSDGGTTTPTPPSATDPYGAAVLADGPVAYWRFDEASGAAARDELGAHAGSFYGEYERGVPGIAGGVGASLDGATGCVGVGQALHFPGRAAFSVEAWVKVSSYGADGTRVVSTEGVRDGNRTGWSLSASYGDTGYPYFDAWNDNTWVMGAYASTSPDEGKLPLDAWSHLVGTFDDSGEEIWVNGVLRNRVKQTSLGRADDGYLTIGCEGTGSGRVDLPVNGEIDEVAIYDKVLTRAQITNHWNLGRPQ